MLHLLWIDEVGDRIRTLHTVSIDGGETWSETRNVLTTRGNVYETRLLTDPSGQLHLLQVQQDENRELRLAYTIWDGRAWVDQQGLMLALNPSDMEHTLEAVLVGEDQLVVAYTGLAPRDLSGSTVPHLVVAGVTIHPPDEPIETSDLVTNSSGSASATPTSEVSVSGGSPSATPEPAGSVEKPVEPAASSNMYIGLIAGGILTLVLVIIMGIRKYRTP